VPTNRKTAPYQDVTARANSMPRNACLLYRNKTPKGPDSAAYRGVTKLQDGQTFWIGIWPRTVNGEPVVELRLSKKE
jgi:hypothetical protein